jgi:hypothetical protein
MTVVVVILIGAGGILGCERGRNQKLEEGGERCWFSPV